MNPEQTNDGRQPVSRTRLRRVQCGVAPHCFSERGTTACWTILPETEFAAGFRHDAENDRRDACATYIELCDLK
jgi:hypothetical protein